jgi:hypothetical protein
VSAVPVMGGCQHIGCLLLAAHTSQIHPSEDILKIAPVNLSLLHFSHQNIQFKNNPFCDEEIITKYNMVPKVAYDNEMVNAWNRFL